MRTSLLTTLLAVTTLGCVSENASNGNHIVRVDPEPAGENCEHGGSVIRTGIDKNHDDTLDEDEVKSTSYVCSGAKEITCNGAGTIHDGTVTIGNASEFAQLAGVTCLDGDLIIASTGVAEIPSLASLRTVTGAVIVASNQQLASLNGGRP